MGCRRSLVWSRGGSDVKGAAGSSLSNQRHTMQYFKKSDNTIAYLLPLHILNFAFLLMTQFICCRHTACLLKLDGFAAAFSLWFCLVRVISLTSTLSSDGTGLNHCVCKGSQIIPMSALHFSLLPKHTWFQGENVSSFDYMLVFSCSFSYFHLWANEKHSFGCGSATHPSSSSTGRREASGRDSRSLYQTHQSAAESGLAAANSSFLASVFIYQICQEGLFGCTMEYCCFLCYHLYAEWDFQVRSFLLSACFPWHQQPLHFEGSAASSKCPACSEWW